MHITSTNNERVKKVLKLKHRKNRELSKCTVVEGVREICRAHEARVLFHDIYICPEFLEDHGGQRVVDMVVSWQVPTIQVSAAVFAKMSFGDRQEGILAVCEPKLKSFSQLCLGAEPLVVVIEELEKPGNIGAILRTCDGAGVGAVLVGGTKTDVYNPNIIRASLGTVFSLPIAQGTPLQVLEFLNQHHIPVLATSPAGQQAYWNTDLSGAVALVLGSEDQGLSDFWLQAAQVKVSIPMRGQADSLNVSATAAILVYEALRQRR